MLDKSGDVSRGAKTKATPAVNPSTNRAGPGGSFCRFGIHVRNSFEKSVPRLSLQFCATGEVYGQLKPMPCIDTVSSTSVPKATTLKTLS